MIPIPYALDYTVTKQGAVVKQVRCSQCETEFVYALHRQVTGQGTSLLFLDNAGAQTRAMIHAQNNLLRKLQQAIDAVPCPTCGWYQDDMVPILKKRHLRGLSSAGIYLFVGTVLIGLAAMGFNLNNNHLFPFLLFSFLFLILVSVGLMCAKVVLSNSYDPNGEDVDLRTKIGSGRAMLKVEYEKWLASIPPDDELVVNQDLGQSGEDQLVGQLCKVCHSRIGSILDGHYCLLCRYPVHNRCANVPSMIEGENLCKRCGAGLVSEATRK